MEKTASWKIMERQMAREGWNAESTSEKCVGRQEFRSIEGEVNYKLERNNAGKTKEIRETRKNSKPDSLTGD